MHLDHGLLNPMQTDFFLFDCFLYPQICLYPGSCWTRTAAAATDAVQKHCLDCEKLQQADDIQIASNVRLACHPSHTLTAKSVPCRQLNTLTQQQSDTS